MKFSYVEWNGSVVEWLTEHTEFESRSAYDFVGFSSEKKSFNYTQDSKNKKWKY